MVCFFFFKQKTAYEMRISDWSSDVCSSDLLSALKLTELGDAVACVHAGRHRVAKACLECQAGRAEHRHTRHRFDPCRDNNVLRAGHDRSEEHTSELQSLMRISYAVFCLKKKTNLNRTQQKSATV